jgi:hypothetical protein
MRDSHEDQSNKIEFTIIYSKPRMKPFFWRPSSVRAGVGLRPSPLVSIEEVSTVLPAGELKHGGDGELPSLRAAQRVPDHSMLTSIRAFAGIASRFSNKPVIKTPLFA